MSQTPTLDFGTLTGARPSSLNPISPSYPMARPVDDINERLVYLFINRGQRYTAPKNAVSMIQFFLLASDYPPYEPTDMFDDRMDRGDSIAAQSYYPKNLLDALIELHNEYHYNVETVDDWILRTFGEEYQLVRRRPFTALAELEKEDIKRRLMQDTMAPTVRRGRLLNCD